jgi:hypothetical protein
VIAFPRSIRGYTQNEAAHQQAADNLEQLGEAGKDLLEAFGWGAAGDLEGAGGKALDAARKMGEVFINGWKGPPSD